MTTPTTMPMATTNAVTTMVTSGPEALSPATLLRLLWLASPALPVGGFSYSEGLEAAVEHGHVDDEASATAWLRDQLALSQSRGDWAVAARAHAAWQAADQPALIALNHWVLHTRESAELRQQVEQMGRSLLEWLRNGEQSTDPRLVLLSALAPAPTWPVGYALAGVLARANARDTLLSLAFGWAENMAQAAMKAVPLGQAAAQRMLAALARDIPAAVDHALALPDTDRQAHAPMLAILSARHEQQYSRLFRS